MAEAQAEAQPQARRPSGNARPQAKAKKGSAPPPEEPVNDKPKPDAGPKIVPGADPDDVFVAKPKSKAAAKNEKRKAARQKEEPQEVDKVAELAAAMGVTPPPPKPTKPPAAKPPPAAAPAAAPASSDNKDSEPNEVEKKVRALRKKLRAVDDLIAKQKSGSELNADQLSKVAARGEIEAEIARWEALNDVEELNKEVKKLGKKIRQIDELIERKAGGEALNADQEGKIASKERLVAELAKLTDLQSKI